MHFAKERVVFRCSINYWVIFGCGFETDKQKYTAHREISTGNSMRTNNKTLLFFVYFIGSNSKFFLHTYPHVHTHKHASSQSLGIENKWPQKFEHLIRIQVMFPNTPEIIDFCYVLSFNRMYIICIYIPLCCVLYTQNT